MEDHKKVEIGISEFQKALDVWKEKAFTEIGLTSEWVPSYTADVLKLGTNMIHDQLSEALRNGLKFSFFTMNFWENDVDIVDIEKVLK